MLLSVVIILMGTMGAAIPAEALRCNSRVISEGDPADKLLKECGEPTVVDQWEEERSYYFRTPPSPREYRTFEYDGKGYRVRKFVKVERWTYNNGPSRFIDYILIENGKIIKIENGSYGY